MNLTAEEYYSTEGSLNNLEFRSKVTNERNIWFQNSHPLFSFMNQLIREQAVTSPLLFLLLFALSACNPPQTEPVPDISESLQEMTTASIELLSLLDEEQRSKAQRALDDEERYNFNFIPMTREGLMLSEMSLEQRIKTHDLLKTTLSSQGYLKVTGIMHLEDILHILEGENRRFDRDPEQYYVIFFGDPSDSEPWGWRFEGHHLSLTFTSVGVEQFSPTPAFMGTNPAEVRTGPYAGLRVLSGEEDLGRELVQSLSEEQLETAIIYDAAPREIITETDRDANLEEMAGLPVSGMTEGQAELLWHIIKEHAHNLKPDLAEAQLSQIREAGMEHLHFGWAGGLERGDPHYYRIHGPTVLFEYDNVQNNANHVHVVWRDLLNDFGEDLLRQHYESASNSHGHD